MTYRTRRNALLLSFALCLAAPSSSLAAAEGPDSGKPTASEPAAAPAGNAAPAADKQETQAEEPKKAEKRSEPKEPKKVKKDSLSDMQRRHADEGYYGTVIQHNGQSDNQKRHSDEGYYSEVKPYVPPPPEANPEPPPLAQPVSVGPPPLEVPAVKPGSNKGFDDDTGVTGSVTATRHAKSAKELFSTGHYDMAKRHYHESLTIAPNQPELYADYWECCAKTNDWGEARRALEKYFELEPTKKKDYQWAYAQTWYELKNWEKAVPALQEALKYGTHQDMIRGALLKIALHEHNNGEIFNQYSALLKMHPNDYKTQLDFANWLELQQRHSEAIPHYKAAVGAQPTDGATAGRVAYMLMFYNKDFRSAITYYKMAMTGDPTNAAKYQDGIRYAEAQIALGKAAVGKKEQQ